MRQVEGFASLVDAHADAFADLFGALLGEEVRFDGPTEKWIMWPAIGAIRDPREDELATRQIRVVGYRPPAGDENYTFRVGGRPGSCL